MHIIFNIENILLVSLLKLADFVVKQRKQIVKNFVYPESENYLDGFPYKISIFSIKINIFLKRAHIFQGLMQSRLHNNPKLSFLDRSID